MSKLPSLIEPYTDPSDMWDDVDGLRFKLLQIRESGPSEIVPVTKDLFNALIKHTDEILVKLNHYIEHE